MGVPMNSRRTLSERCLSEIMTMSPRNALTMFRSIPLFMPAITPLPIVMRSEPIKSITPMTILFPLCRTMLRHAIFSISFMLLFHDPAVLDLHRVLRVLQHVGIMGREDERCLFQL